MSDDLKKEIRDELVQDEAVLKEYLSEVKKFLTLDEDGKTVLDPDILNLKPKVVAVAYFIGRKFAYESDLREDSKISNGEMYDLLTIANSTVRKKLGKLNEEGILTKIAEGEYKLKAQNVPHAVQYIKKHLENSEEKSSE